jgi:hypothetical protein
MNAKAINFGQVEHGKYILRNMIDIESVIGEGHFDDLVLECVYTENGRAKDRATIHIPIDTPIVDGVFYIEPSDLYNFNDGSELDLVSYMLTTKIKEPA